MKTIKLLFAFALTAVMLTSCVVEENYIEKESTISLNQLLGSYELWYVDINATQGYVTTPFLQKAFTMSFRNGGVYANNNIVGLGDTGNGFGIKIGNYDAYGMILDISHIIDGFSTYDIFQIDNNTIELYNPKTDTSYFLDGYQRNTFDYDFVFYDNIHYFLQEYNAWEKVYTSDFGAINEFDNENYLQFLAGGNDSEFRSSQDRNGKNINNIFWDYTGVYGVGNVAGNNKLKTLTLDYDYFDDEYFELTVINDGKIELYQPSSGTAYEFVGKGYIQFMKTAITKEKSVDTDKMRKFRKDKVDNPRTNTRG